MKASPFLVLLLAALARASFVVKVSGSEDNMKIHLEGEEVAIITDKEQSVFKLTDNNVKRGVERAFGKLPTDAYLRSPTPWGDLYQNDGFNEVTRHLKPIEGRVVHISAEPSILRYQCFVNNFTVPINTNAAISQTVSKTVSQSWNRKHDLSFDYSIDYEFTLELVKVKTETSLSYKGSWGESEARSETETIGATAGIALELPPGGMVEGILQASRGRVIIEVDYEARLQGNVAVNYDEPYKGHHFWGIDINQVLTGAGLETVQKYKGTLEIGFYSNSKVTINDPICDARGNCRCEHDS